MRYYAGHALFKKEQWDQINSPILNEILPRMHINRKTPRVQIYGSKLLGGFNFIPLQTIQFNEMIKILINGL